MRAGFHAILTCGPVQTSFKVDIEIYEDKLGQSGDRILSSHMTNTFISLSYMQTLFISHIHNYFIKTYKCDSRIGVYLPQQLLHHLNLFVMDPRQSPI